MNRYHIFSRSPYYAIIGSLPLLVAYELLVLASKQGRVEIRNAGDVWLRELLGIFGLTTTHAYLAMILVLLFAIPLVKRQEISLVPRYFAFMLAEGLAYSLVLGFAINILLQPLFFTLAALPIGTAQAVAAGASSAGLPLAMPGGGGWSQILAQSIGAGLFEEFLFRVILLNLLLWTMRLVLREWVAALVSIVGAALLFSLAHYFGPLADPFDPRSFLFRWMAGMLFTILYYMRGFAVTAYAHTLYDIRVMLF